MPLKQYLTHTVIQNGKIIQANLGEFEVSGSPTFRFDCQTAMHNAANAKFGVDKWKWRQDKSLGGQYVCATHEPNKGETIHVDPFPVAKPIDPPLE